MWVSCICTIHYVLIVYKYKHKYKYKLKYNYKLKHKYKNTYTNTHTSTDTNTNTNTNTCSLSLDGCGAGSLWVELWIAKVGPPGVSKQAANVKFSVLTTKVVWKMAQSKVQTKGPHCAFQIYIYASQGKTLKESVSHYIGVKVKFRQNYK